MTRQMVRVTERYILAHKDKINSENIATTIAVMILPFMQNILNRYDESDFHRVMRQQYVDEQGLLVPGFDFVGDWRKNHPTAFGIMTYFARQFRRNLNYNVEVATNLITDILLAWGWKISRVERNAIGHMLYRIKRLIFIV